MAMPEALANDGRAIRSEASVGNQPPLSTTLLLGKHFSSILLILWTSRPLKRIEGEILPAHGNAQGLTAHGLTAHANARVKCKSVTREKQSKTKLLTYSPTIVEMPI